MRQILLEQDEDGVWIAECPSLPGCYSDGPTREAAIANIREAIELWIEDALEDGRPLPENSHLEIVELEFEVK